MQVSKCKRGLAVKAMRRFAALDLAERHFFSTILKTSRRGLSRAKRSKNRTDNTIVKVGEIANSSLKEITGILGSLNASSEGNSVSQLSRRVQVNTSCAEPVCRKSEPQSKILDQCVVPRMVGEIVEIVRAEDEEVPMELKLAGFPVIPEVVEKVLKCLFEMPHSAFRFFDWAKASGCSPNVAILNILVCIAGEARDYTLLNRMLKELENALSVRGVQTWTLLIMQFGKVNLLDKALLCFENMKKSGCDLTAEVYGVLIRLLCDAGRTQLALKLHMEMAERKIKLDVSLFRLLLRCLSNSGNVLSIQLVADQMIELHQFSERDVYGNVLKSLCLSGRVAEFLVVYQGLRNRGKYIETLTSVLRRSEKGAEALEVLQLIRKMGRLDEKVYENLISRYLRKNELSKALDLFQSMKECRHQPTKFTCIELTKHCFNLKRCDKGCTLYEDMVKEGLEVDSATIMNAVCGYVQLHNLPRALEVFKTLMSKGIQPTLESITTLLETLNRVSRVDDILEFLQEMFAFKSLGMNKVFNCVVSYMEKTRNANGIERVTKMRRIYHQLQSSEACTQNLEDTDGFPGKTSEQVKCESPYNELELQKVNIILSSSQDWLEMQEELDKCKFEFTPEVVVEIMRENRRHGRIALQFFSWVGNVAGYQHNSDSYNIAIKIAGGGKDFASMRNLFHEMRRKNFSITSDTWAIMIMQYGRTGLTKTALRTFAEMNSKGCKPSYSIYKCLITCLCENKPWKVDVIIQLFQTMIHSGYLPERKLVETYLICLCGEDKISVARKCVDSLCHIGFRNVDSQALYVRALCRAGRVEEALSFVDEMGTEHNELDKNTFGSLVHGLLRKGKLEQALTKISSMKQLGIHPSCHVYTSLIVHFFREKQPGKALEVMGKMQKEGCDPTIVTYYSIIRGYMSMGRTADAWKIFQSLKANGMNPDFKTYSMFIHCLCEHGGSEEALQLVAEMKQTGIVPSSINYKTVFFGLNREGKYDLARTVLHKKSALKCERQTHSDFREPVIATWKP